jgi:hypothetical protein
MALSIPSRPQIYQGDPFAHFKDAYSALSGIKQEQDAKSALEKYATGLYGQPPAGAAAPPVNPQSIEAMATSPDPAERMIGAEHSAAAGATDPTLNAYFGAIRGAESAGNDAAKNPNSSATGRYQFTDGTWADVAQRHPDLGLTPDGRMDPAQQEKAIRALTMDNIGSLRQSQIPITPGNLYAAHFLGAGGASKALTQPDDTPMSAVVGPEVLQANPQLGQMTVGQFKEWTASKGGNAQGGYQAPMAQPDGQAAPAASGASANGLPDRDTLVALFRNPVTRPFAADLVKTVGTEGKPTDVQQNYLVAVKQGYQGSLLDYQKELKSGTTVNVGDNSSKFQNKADELAAGRLSDYVTAGNDAQQFTGDMMQLAELSKTLTTGKTAQIAAALGPYAEALGVKIDGLSDAQAYDSIISRLAPKMRAPGSGSSSDTDVNMFLRSLPNLGNTPEGNQIIINTFQGVQQQKIKASEISQQALSGQITWQEADKQISALGDPYTAFKKYQADTAAGNKASPAAASSAPPASYDGDPSLWQYMTPEQRALWQ